MLHDQTSQPTQLNATSPACYAHLAVNDSSWQERVMLTITPSRTALRSLQAVQVVLQHLVLSPDPTPLSCHPASHPTALTGCCCCSTSPQQQHPQQQQQHVIGSAPAELSCSQQQSRHCSTHQAHSLLQQQHYHLWPAQLSWMIQRQQTYHFHLVHAHNQQQLSMQSYPYCQQQQQQQQQQVRGYHPSTHAARSLTSKLLQQKSWQDLQQLFQAAGGGSRLNPIQLCALLQQLARLAPPAELLPAAEKGQLRGFADQLAAVCLTKLHKLDAVGLANVISSAIKLGCSLPRQQAQLKLMQQQAAAISPADSSSSRMKPVQHSPSLIVELLTAATKQVAFANGHSTGMLLAALASLQQQQQQQQGQQLSLLHAQQQQQQQQQQHLLLAELEAWHGFIAAASQRLQAVAAADQLMSADASKLCLTVSRLAGMMARQRTAAVAAAAAVAATGPQAAVKAPQDTQSTQQQLQEQQQEVLSAGAIGVQHDISAQAGAAYWLIDGPVPEDGLTSTQQHFAQAATAIGAGAAQLLQQRYSQLQQQLRSLLSLSAQQVVEGTTAATATPVVPLDSLSDASRVLYALAKTWAWPGWLAVQGLLQQYQAALQAVSILAAASPQQHQGRKGKRQQQGVGLLGFMAAAQQNPSAAGGSAAADDPRAVAAAAVRDSLAPTLWAVGRLLEQQQQQQQRRHRQQQQQQQELLQELQQHRQLWRALGPVLGVAQQQLHWLGPLQLAQVASGLGKLVHSSNSLIQAAGQLTSAAAAAGGRVAEAGHDLTAVSAAAAGLAELLQGAKLQRLLQQHVSRVESLLPLLAQPHRLQLAGAYQQLGVHLPRSVDAVFERDAAQQQQQHKGRV